MSPTKNISSHCSCLWQQFVVLSAVSRLEKLVLTPRRNIMEGLLCKCMPGYYRRIEIVDEPCNLLSSANFALVCAYFSVGFVGSLLRTPLNVYLVHTLSAEPEMQNTIGILQTLPWSYKLLFGFVSDAVPIYG